MPLLLGNSQTTGKWGLVLAWKGRRSLNISGQNKSSRNRHKLCFQTLPPKSLQVGKPASINSERAQRGSNGLAGPHLFGSLSSPATPPPNFYSPPSPSTCSGPGPLWLRPLWPLFIGQGVVIWSDLDQSESLP